MRRIIALLAVVCCVLELAGEEITTELRQALLSETAVRPAKGKVCVIDLRSGFDTRRIGEFFFPSGKCLKIPFEIVGTDGAFDIASAGAEVKRRKAKAVIFIVNEPKLPMSFAAPEEEWAVINYGKIVADGAPEAIVNRRMDKMFSRAVMQILGGGSHMEDPLSAMRRVNSIKDLDALRGVSPSPMGMASMGGYLAELGIRAEETAPYIVACQEGWAPAPTNGIQKAIWDKVHAPPSKPIKITYDKDKQKPVVK